MKQILFSVIQAAKENDIAAAEEIRTHFKGYIVSKCLKNGKDSSGNTVTVLDTDAHYFAETALLAAIFTFQFREPPDNYTP